MSCANVIVRSLLPAIAAFSTIYAQPGRAETESEFLLFPYLQQSYLSGLADGSGLDDDEFDYGLDLFAAIGNGRFDFLGEALLAKEEQEIERLQFGLRIGGDKAWLGRFHNPIGYWNNQYHHGVFLQSTNSRPAIVEYEDDSGILPMHLTGLLVEGIREHDKQGYGYAFAIGFGPELTDELEPLDVLDPKSGSQDLAVAINLYRQPLAYGPNQYGLFASYTEIPASQTALDEIRQLVAGGYWNSESDPWRLTGSAFYLRNRLNEASGDQTDEFVSAYIQAERWLGDEWTVFGRFEKTFADDNDVFLQLFPDFARERVLAGARVDLFERHALKLEFSSIDGQNDRYRQFTLQWAAMF